MGTVYMRLWLESGDAFIRCWEDPDRLFELLFRRLLCDIDRNHTVTNMCIRCLERLYALHAHTIGVFHDVMILVRSMALTTSAESQHRILSLLATLLGVAGEDDGDEEDDGRVRLPGNAEQLLNAESISLLCQYVAWGHTNRAQVGNLMNAHASGSTHGTMPMLTDGGGDGAFAASARHARAPAPPSDADPRVWLVARSGPRRVPPTSDRRRRSIQYRRMRGQLPVGPQYPDRTCASGPCACISPSDWGCSSRRLTGTSRSCRRRCAKNSPGLLCRHYVEQAALRNPPGLMC